MTLYGLPKTDLLTYAQVFSGGYSGYWDENDQYAVTPFGELPPYYEGYTRHGYEFSIGGGSSTLNPFGLGAVAGTPGTLPFDWEKTDALGVSSFIAYAGSQSEAYKLSIGFNGISTGAGTAVQYNFCTMSVPSGLPSAGANNNWCYDIHALNYENIGMNGTEVYLGFQTFDSSYNLLTTGLNLLSLPPYPINMRDCRHAFRTGGLPAGTARIGMFLRVNTTAAGVDMSWRRLWIAMPAIANRGSPGNLPGFVSSNPTNAHLTPQSYAELLRIPQWLNPDQGTFCIRFKLAPTAVSNGNTRTAFAFTNYISPSIFTVQMSAAIRPNLQVISNWTAGGFSRVLATNIDTNVWHRVSVSYVREAGQVTVKSCWAPETSYASPAVYTDIVSELVPFLFGTIGGGGASFRSARNSLCGYLDFFDYYPYAMGDEQLQRVTGQP